MAALLWGCFGRWGTNARGTALEEDDAAPACPQRSSSSGQPQHLLPPASKVAPAVTCVLKDDSGQLPTICGVGYAGSDGGLCDTGVPMLTPNHSQGGHWVSTSSSSTLCHQPLPPLQQPPGCKAAASQLPVKPQRAACIGLEDDPMVGHVGQLGAAGSNSSPLLQPHQLPLGGGLHSISAISSVASEALSTSAAAAGSTRTLPLIQLLQSYACIDSTLIKRSDASCTSPSRQSNICDTAPSISSKVALARPPSLPGFKQLAIPGSKSVGSADELFNLAPSSRGSGNGTRTSPTNDHDMPSMRTIIAAPLPPGDATLSASLSTDGAVPVGATSSPPSPQPRQQQWYAHVDLQPVQVSTPPPCTCHACVGSAQQGPHNGNHSRSSSSSSSIPPQAHSTQALHAYQPPPSGCSSPHGSSARSADLVISEPETADVYQDNVLLSMLYSNAILVGGDEAADDSSEMLPRISPTPSASTTVRRENTDEALDGVLVPLSLLDPDAPATGLQDTVDVHMSGESPTWPAAQQAALDEQQQQQQQSPPSTELSSITFTSPSAPRLMAVAIGGKLVDVPSVSLDTQSCRSLPAGFTGARGGFNASPWVQSQPLPSSTQGILAKQDGRGLGTSAPLLGASRQSRYGRPGMCSPMVLLNSTQDLNSIAETEAEGEEDSLPSQHTL